MTNFTVIIPALNEEKGIGAVLDRLHALSPKPEIIVVDDGSTDGTGEMAQAKGARVLKHPAPGGYGRSLKDGIGIATHDIVAITDADGTYPVERLPEMVVSMEQGFDMVVGARQGKHYRGTFLKMPARILFKWLVEFTTGRSIPDINSGLRVFRKSEVTQYFDDLCNGFSFTTTITLIYMLTGKFVRYVSIDYAKREGKSKVKIIRDSLRTLQYITEVIAVYNPLKLFILIAGTTGFIGLVLLISGVTMVESAFLVLVGTIFVIGACIIFSLGILTHARNRS